MPVCYDFREMDDGNKFNLKDLIKKPAVIVGGVVVVLILLGTLIFGGGESVDPRAVEIKNLSNRHAAVIEVIDKYGKDVRSANLRSNLAQASIILTANKSEVDEYYKSSFAKLKEVKATFKEKPSEKIVAKLEDGIVDNNLDKVLQATVVGELEEISRQIVEVRQNNSEKKKLGALMDKLGVNIQTLRERVGQPL